MQDAGNDFEADLAGLPKGEWLTELAEVVEKQGFFQPLGPKHFAAHVRRGDTLLVTFETVQGMRGLSKASQPFGWSMVRDAGWSHLCIASDGDTWFRDRHVIGVFDRMVDDGFFDDFEQVIFYGAGPCGYAAAAYSVAAPGARVMIVQPQATLDPRVTEWDDRFREQRRIDFTSRYGYAPDMLDACDQAYVLYDPNVQLDAMHAALFSGANVKKFRMRHMGSAIQGDLMGMELLSEFLALAADGALDDLSFAKIYRARRTHRWYLRRLLASLEAKKRTELVYMLTKNVTARMNAPRFQNVLTKLEAARDADKTNDVAKEG